MKHPAITFKMETKLLDIGIFAIISCFAPKPRKPLAPFFSPNDKKFSISYRTKTFMIQKLSPKQNEKSPIYRTLLLLYSYLLDTVPNVAA